jgi:hypothetical protein
MVLGEVTIHPCEILLICPAEACHASMLDRSTAIIAIIAIITIIYPTPDSVFSLVIEISGAVIARLFAPIALTDIIALLLALRAEVRQNDLVHVAVWAPAVSSRRSVAWMIAL